MLSFGVLWPNVLSLAALPAAIALLFMVLHLMPRSPRAGRHQLLRVRRGRRSP